MDNLKGGVELSRRNLEALVDSLKDDNSLGKTVREDRTESLSRLSLLDARSGVGGHRRGSV